MQLIERFGRMFCTAFLMSASVLMLNAQTETGELSVFDQAGSFSPMELIQGKVSGVRVFATDGNPSGMRGVQVRGIHSFRGDSQPQYVVDGVMLGISTNANRDAFWQYGDKAYTSVLDPLAFISSYDIESVQVIKDIDATAIYGSRGANGVILITTKNASEGSVNVRWNTDLTVLPVLSHNHNVSINGSKSRNSYNISAFYRNRQGTVSRNNADNAGVRLSFKTAANSIVSFGFNSHLTMGNVSNTTATAWFGQGSALLDADNSSWISDYDDDTKEYRTVNSVYLNLDFTPYFSWKTSAGVDYQNLNRIIWYGRKTAFGGEVNSAAAMLNSMLMNYNASSRFCFSQYFAQRHYISASAGVEVVGNQNRFNTMNGVNLLSEALRGKGLSLMQSQKQIRKFTRSYFTGRAFAEGQYDFDGFFGIKAGVSAEVSPKYRDYTPALYPFASGYVDLHKALIKDNDILSTFRAEAGWGVSGNELFVPYEMTSDYLTGQWFQVDGDAGVYYDGLNRVLTQGWNAGLRLGFISDRIMLGLSYYEDLTYDAYDMFCFGKLDGGLWRYSDRKQVFQRVASFSNRGVDVDFSAVVIDNGDWDWTLYASGSYNVNRIISASRQDMWGRTIGKGMTGTVNAVGHQIGSFYGFRQDEQGNIVDLTRDGSITDADRTILGNSIPEYYGGFGTTLSFKGISLDVMMTGAAGFHVANLTRLAADGHGQLLGSYVEKGDYLRLSRVSVGYDIPLDLKWIRSLKVHASAHDLLTLTSYTGNNPDVSSYGVSALSYGYDYGAYPLMKTFVLGISAEF